MEIGQLATARSSIGGRPVGRVRNIIPSTYSSSRAGLRWDERISDGGIDKVIRRRSGKQSATKTETP